MQSEPFAAFILSHGRPDKVVTHNTLRRCGYTGRIIIVVDDLDKTAKQYVKKYGAEVVVFDKKQIAALVDNGDNFQDLRTTTHARNAIFEIAKAEGIKHFVMLDDDYTTFSFRFDRAMNYNPPTIQMRNADAVFASMVKFLVDAGLDCVAMAQGGDFLGGGGSDFATKVQAKRKIMNTFFCTTDRPFRFFSRLNEDVNTYLALGARGKLFLTTLQASIVQAQTQATAGGMTDAYLKYGTYVKSFTSVMYAPSSVKVSMIRGQKSARIHHRITWRHTVPMILRESLKKGAAAHG